MQVGDHHSVSARPIIARQLQALVRLTLPRSHRHGLIFRGAAQGGHRRRVLAPRCAQGGTSPAGISLGHHHDSDWLRAIAPRPSPALHPTSSTTATLRETELELILMVRPNYKSTDQSI